MAKKIRPPKMHSVKVNKKDPWMNQHVSFTDIELPQSKEWEVGKTYKLELEVKQVSSSNRENEGFKAEFLVTKVKALT